MKYVVIDTETTGLDPDKCGLVEIALRMSTGETLQTFVNPGVPIPPESSAVHHLTKWDVESAPTPQEAATLVLDFLKLHKPDFFVAHNAAFDRSFLAKVLPAVAKVPWLCTYRMARHLMPEEATFSLQVLRYALELGINPAGAPHRAMYDVECCQALFEYLVAFAKQFKPSFPLDLDSREGAAKTAEALSRPCLLVTCPIGKEHKGKRFSDVPASFLRWCVDTIKDDVDLVHTCKTHLASKQ